MLLFRGDAESVAMWMKLYLSQADETAVIGVLASDDVLETLGKGLFIIDRQLARDGLKIISLGKTDNPAIAARRFYDALRAFDEIKADIIYCEYCERGGIGDALADRMLRAACSNIINACEPDILFVCTGNTCRSAMAEVLFNDAAACEDKPFPQPASSHGAKRRKPHMPRALSAGIYAADGATASIEAIDTMSGYNIDLTHHRSRPLNNMLLMRSVITLTMTRSHKNEVLKRYPAASGRVFTIGEFITQIASTHKNAFNEANGKLRCNFPDNMDMQWLLSRDDIEDPFGRGLDAYQKCAEKLFYMIDILVRLLMSSGFY
jgi:protein-tyrosine-phosphatase